MVAVCVMAILYSSVPDMITQLQAPRLARATSDAAMLAAALWGPTPNYQGFIGRRWPGDQHRSDHRFSSAPPA